MTQPNAMLRLVETLGSRQNLENELQALITRHGREAVRDAAKRLTKGKKGRKQERDWPIIGPEISRQDALDWIAGRDPLKLRTNYSIAKDFAHRFPGQSELSTHRRIMRKLRKSRAWFYEIIAWEMAGSELSYRTYFEVSAKINASDESWRHVLTNDYDLKVGMLERYRNQIGEPDPEMTFAQIEKALQDYATSNTLPAHAKRTGLFGSRRVALISKYTPRINNDEIER